MWLDRGYLKCSISNIDEIILEMLIIKSGTIPYREITHFVEPDPQCCIRYFRYRKIKGFQTEPRDQEINFRACYNKMEGIIHKFY